jgi:hypothetical protein
MRHTFPVYWQSIQFTFYLYFATFNKQGNISCWNALHFLFWSVLSLSLTYDSWVTEHVEKNIHAKDGNYEVTKWYIFICIHLVFTVYMFWLLVLKKRNTCHMGSEMVLYIPLSYIHNLLHHTWVTLCALHTHSHQTAYTEVSSTVDRATRTPAPDTIKCPVPNSGHPALCQFTLSYVTPIKFGSLLLFVDPLLCSHRTQSLFHNSSITKITDVYHQSCFRLGH